MSEPTRVSHPKEILLSTDVEGFDSLAELALDMRSSWNYATDRVWRQLDPVLWELTHNPWAVLQTVSREKLQRDLADPDFRKSVDDLVEARRDAAEAPAWFQTTYPLSPLNCVAYFSMEFMLSEALPIYSGGLGNVAGDPRRRRVEQCAEGRLCPGFCRWARRHRTSFCARPPGAGRRRRGMVDRHR